MKIYHNSRCKKSRAGYQYLKNKNIDFKVVEYLKDDPFTFDSLKSLLKKLGKKPHDMIRTQEQAYKDNHKGKDLSDDQWIKAMVENPKLIQRPIIEKDDMAVWGDPPSNIDKLV